VMTF